MFWMSFEKELFICTYVHLYAYGKKALIENILIQLAISIARAFSGTVLSAICKITLRIYYGTCAPGTRWMICCLLFARYDSEYGEVVGG